MNTLRSFDISIPILLLVLFGWTSCMSDESTEIQTDDVLEEVDDRSDFMKIVDDHFEMNELPLSCEVNFDNYEADEFLTERQFEMCELYMVFPEGYEPGRYAARDKIVKDNGITILTVTSQDNEHELSTYLVTYSPEEWYVDHVRIAYDEIAEGFLQIKSYISGDTIKRITLISLDEVMEETERYFIDKDGQIVWEQEL